MIEGVAATAVQASKTGGANPAQPLKNANLFYGLPVFLSTNPLYNPINYPNSTSKYLSLFQTNSGISQGL